MMRWVLWGALWGFLAACTPADGDDVTENSPDAMTGDGGAADEDAAMEPMDAAMEPVDEGLEADADPPEPDAEAADMGLWSPPAAAPEEILERLPVETWMRAFPPSGEDPLWDAYDRGEIELPEAEGVADNGVRWVAIGENEDGTLADFGMAEGYAVTEIPLDEGERLVGRVDRGWRIWTQGGVQPADIYGAGRSLVPLVGDGETVRVAVLPVPRRGAPRVQLFKTTHEVVFNTSDMTLPDLLVNDGTDRWVGVPVVNTGARAIVDATAQVLENDYLEATAVAYPGLPGGAVTQVGFTLTPKAPWDTHDVEVPITLRVESPSLERSYEKTITLTTRRNKGGYRQSFRSNVDHSVQYYGVRIPKRFDEEDQYGLVLSLHGAGVEAIGQVGAYSDKEWAFVVAGTNRRPFGFDWEEWGRLNAINTLDDAMARFGIDPTRVYLTGHSMGGHGTWHVGTSTPGRFGAIAPSAGWSSFYSYGGADRPTGPVGRARAHSDTNNYLGNLARRGVYILHGDADDNVPVTEGRNMFAEAGMHTDDIEYFEQPGAGHWWNGPRAEGVDCVDWPPIFEFFEARPLDPHETDFTFRAAMPSYANEHSFVRLESATFWDGDMVITSRREGDRVLLETTNVRSMRLDGAALTALGVTEADVDGEVLAVPDASLWVGPAEGKRADRHGPFNQAFRKPFCYIYPNGHAAYAKVAAFYTSHWALIGNGHACALPERRAYLAQEAGLNLIRLGDTAADIRVAPFDWDEGGILFGEQHVPGGSLMFVQPEGDGVSAGLVATPGDEMRLTQIVPFSSRSGMPDYLIWSSRGAAAIGFFDNDWMFNPMWGLP